MAVSLTIGLVHMVLKFSVEINKESKIQSRAFSLYNYVPRPSSSMMIRDLSLAF